MISAPARISLFVTLGIAAIDLLSCAFISSVVLFVMFLIPKTVAAGGGTGKEQTLAVHWAFTSNRAVLAIQLKPSPTATPVTIWTSPTPAFSDQDCAKLSASGGISGACSVTISEKRESGMLVIRKPLSGQWDVGVSYADSIDSENSPGPGSVSFEMSVIGKQAVTLEQQLSSGAPQLSIRKFAADHAGALDIP
jgi:hypothetical protein